MNLQPKTFSKFFVIAGLMNLSVLIFSRLFTNEIINNTDPEVMSNFGLIMIMVWGLAYVSVAKTYENVKWLIVVFAVEKLIYGVVWLKWITTNDVSVVYEKDMLAGLFYSIYGVNDLMFFLFFAFISFKLFRKN